MARKRVEIKPQCGKRLKDWLNECNITQEELGNRIHLSQQTISKIVNGKATLTPDVARLISESVPNADGEFILSDYLLNPDFEHKTESALLHSRLAREYRCDDLIDQLIQSHGYKLIYKDIPSRDKTGAFYIPMVEITDENGNSRYWRIEEYKSFTNNVNEILEGLLLVAMQKRTGKR